MTVAEFMKKTGVSKRKYVEAWITQDLIPNVKRDETTGALCIPDSARRPYCPRVKADSDANAIRASMLNACLRRQHISPKIYWFLSEGEFFGYINDLIRAELIRERVEDEISYYDATPKSRECSGRTCRAIRKFVIDCLGKMAERAAYGTVQALRSLPDAS